MSDCLADFLPAVWTLDWASVDIAQRAREAQAFGLSADALPELMAWCTSEFDQAWGWPGAIYELNTARAFARRFLPAVADLKLLALALPEDLVPVFIEEARPRTPQEGPLGVFTCVLSNRCLAPGGTPLGWEILGLDMASFHSWLCNGLEVEVFNEFGIRPGANGLLHNEADARRAAEHCGQEKVGAEPALWQPWALVEYSLLEATDAAA